MSVVAYTVRRFFLAIPVFLGALIIIFVVTRFLPGDPVDLLIPRQERTPERVAAVKEKLGLDKPLGTQFILYIRGVFSGDWGMAWSTGNKVLFDVKHRLGATVELGFISLLLGVAISVPLGVLAAVYRDSWIDHLCRTTAVAGVSIPIFWLGLLLIYFLYFKLRVLPPPTGRTPIGFELETITGLYTVDTLLQGELNKFFTILHYLALPVITMSLPRIAPLARLTRSSMIEVLQSDYIRTARAMGFSETVIRYKYALKNALTAPLTMLGITFAYILAGSAIIETVFAWPGIGLWAVNAASVMDYNAVQGFAIITTFMVIVSYFLVDVAYVLIDPKIEF